MEGDQRSDLDRMNSLAPDQRIEALEALEARLRADLDEDDEDVARTTQE